MLSDKGDCHLGPNGRQWSHLVRSRLLACRLCAVHSFGLTAHVPRRIVGSYYQFSADWADVSAFDISSGIGDPMYVVQGLKKR